MRILVVTPYLPWPLNTGGNGAQFSTLQCLGSEHEFTLVCPVHGKLQQRHSQELARRLPNVRVRPVYCGEPLSTPWPVRTLRRILRRIQHATDPGERGAALPANPFRILPSPLIEAVQEELDRGTDLCQAEFAPMLPLGSWFPADIPRLFVHHQVQFVYADRFLEAHGGSSVGTYLRATMRVQELAYLQHFDGVITFSDDDRQYLLPYVPAPRLFTSPFPIPADVGFEGDPSQDFDGRFLYVASEVHDPNVDALEWLVAEIWPKISAQLSSASLIVIGQWSESLRKRFAAPNLSFAGFVPDLSSTMRGGIMLVPIRIGSGIRAKILAALAQGVPVVSTPVGSEGLLVRDEEELLVRAGASDFASAAVRLAAERDLRMRLSIAGREAVLRNYSADQVRRRRNEIYSILASNRRKRPPEMPILPSGV
jgi:polysaccharide biosynthesis protein PslH